MKTKHLLILLIPAFLISACYNDNLQELTPSSGLDNSVSNCDTAGVMTYSANISPIFNASCGTTNSCHGSNNNSGVNLSAYNGVRAAAIKGTLLASIKWTGSAVHMPKNGSKLNDCVIKKIEKWVNAGAQNN